MHYLYQLPYWCIGAISALFSSATWLFYRLEDVTILIFGQVDTSSFMEVMIKEGGVFGIYAVFVIVVIKLLLDFCGKQIRAEFTSTTAVLSSKIDTINQKIEMVSETTERNTEELRRDIKNTREFFKRAIKGK